MIASGHWFSICTVFTILCVLTSYENFVEGTSAFPSFQPVADSKVPSFYQKGETTPSQQLLSSSPESSTLKTSGIGGVTASFIYPSLSSPDLTTLQTQGIKDVTASLNIRPSPTSPDSPTFNSLGPGDVKTNLHFQPSNSSPDISASKAPNQNVQVPSGFQTTNSSNDKGLVNTSLTSTTEDFRNSHLISVDLPTNWTPSGITVPLTHSFSPHFTAQNLHFQTGLGKDSSSNLQSPYPSTTDVPVVSNKSDFVAYFGESDFPASSITLSDQALINFSSSAQPSQLATHIHTQNFQAETLSLPVLPGIKPDTDFSFGSSFLDVSNLSFHPSDITRSLPNVNTDTNTPYLVTTPVPLVSTSIISHTSLISSFSSSVPAGYITSHSVKTSQISSSSQQFHSTDLAGYYSVQPEGSLIVNIETSSSFNFYGSYFDFSATSLIESLNQSSSSPVIQPVIVTTPLLPNMGISSILSADLVPSTSVGGFDLASTAATENNFSDLHPNWTEQVPPSMGYFENQTREIPGNDTRNFHPADYDKQMGVPVIVGIALGSLGFIFLLTLTVLGLCHRRKLIKREVLGTKTGPYHNHYTGLWDDELGTSTSYINQDPDQGREEMISLDNDTFLNSLEGMTFTNNWGDNKPNTRF